MNPRCPIMKCIAFSISIVFLITSLGITPQTFAASSFAQIPEMSGFSTSALEIPAELGQVTDGVPGAASAPVMIHIQAAHGNYAAEKNIENLLGYIEENSKIHLLFLEGAAQKLQPETFRLFPDNRSFNSKVTEKLIREGYLTGPESFLIDQTFDKKGDRMQAFGIEDLSAYKKDREAFIRVVRQEKTAEKFLGSMRTTIDKRFSAKLNKDLLNLVRQEEALDSGTVTFQDWIKVLGEGSRKHLKVDLSDAYYQAEYPFLIRYFRLQAIGSKIDRDKALMEAGAFIKELERRGISKEIIENFKTVFEKNNGQASSRVQHPASKVPGFSPLRHAFDIAFEKLPKDFSMARWPAWTLYAQQLILLQELEGKGLHEETELLESRILTALAQTSEEKEYVAAVRQLYLLKKLFSLELTRGEYEELLNKVKSVPLSSNGQDNAVSGAAVQELYDSATAFYSTAVLREEKMFRNALRLMNEQKQQRAVIVTGGFHTDGLKALAASKSCSYLQITPRISEASKHDREIYLKSILGSRPVETSQMSALLGLVDRAQRVAVTGIAATSDWLREIRNIIQPMINSEAVSERPALIAALSRSFLAPAVARAEVRGAETTALGLDLSRVSADSSALNVPAQEQKRLREIQSELLGQIRSAVQTEEGRIGLIKGWREWLAPWIYFGVRISKWIRRDVEQDGIWKLAGTSALERHPVLNSIIGTAVKVRETGAKNWVHLGAGGSSLTTQALVMPVVGRNYNELSDRQRQDRPRVYWAGHNYDPEHLTSLLVAFEGRGELFKTMYHLVSKSGTTGETFAAYNIIRHWLETRLLQIYDLYKKDQLSSADLERLGLTGRDITPIGTYPDGRLRFPTGRFFVVTTGLPQTSDLQVNKELIERLNTGFGTGLTPASEVAALKSEFLKQHFTATQQGNYDPFFAILPVPEGMGGRFSTFSPVGLVDLAVVGASSGEEKQIIDTAIRANRDAAQKYLDILPADSKDNVPFRTAWTIFHLSQLTPPKREVLELFNFAPQYDAVVQLMRELWNESVEDRREDETQGRGPMLRTLEGSTHDHTDVQGILGGNRDLRMVWLWGAQVAPQSDIQLAPGIAMDSSVRAIEKHTLGTIQASATTGNAEDLSKNGIPVFSWNLPERDVYSTAYLIATLQLMVAVYGDLRGLGLQTYLQRYVEGYKVETKKALGAVPASEFGGTRVPVGPVGSVKEFLADAGIGYRSEVRAMPVLGPTHPELEDLYKQQVEASTPAYVKRGNPIFDITNPGRIEGVLKHAHLYPYKAGVKFDPAHPGANDEGLGLMAWLEDYEAEAKIATAGIRLTQNILYPWDTRNRINEIGIAFATLAKALVSKELYPGKSLEKMAGGESRYNTKRFVDMIARIQAAQGIRTYVPVKRHTTPIWMVSMLTFMFDLVGAEHVTSSHAGSNFSATKDINNQGSQYLPEESARFVGKIREMFETAKRDGEYRFAIAAANDPLIDEGLMKATDDGTDVYVQYLKNGVATDVNLSRIRGMKQKIIIDSVGGSMYRTMTRIFSKLGIAAAFDWFHTEEDPFFHGIGKERTAEGKVQDYTQDTTVVKRDKKTGETTSIPVMERMGYDKLLKNAPIGQVVLMTDPDGDRLVTAQVESMDRADYLKKLGVEILRLDDKRILAVYSPNQSFFMTMVYHADSLKSAGLWDKHPRFLIMTTASSPAWREWAEANGVQVINVPVGFKEIAAGMKKGEAVMTVTPEGDVIVTDVFGRKVNLGKDPRMIFAGEESGGMIIGPEELIVSRGGRKAIAMREKSAGEALVIQSAMAAYLESEGKTFSGYLEELFDKNNIASRFDVRHDQVFYNQSEPDPDRLKEAKAKGEIEREKNYAFFVNMVLSKLAGKTTLSQIIEILDDAFAAQGLRFDDLQDILFVGDGVYMQFPDKVLEIRPSGTDAKSKSYGYGKDKLRLAVYAQALGGYSGEPTAMYKQFVDMSNFEEVRVVNNKPVLHGEDVRGELYDKYYREGLPAETYQPMTVEFQPVGGPSVRVTPAKAEMMTVRSEVRTPETAGPIKQKILVVDDEPEIQDFVIEFLSFRGYDVQKAGDGEEALKILDAANASGHPFDLLITDGSMPKMNGVRLLGEAKRRYPGMKRILVSGGIPGVHDLASLGEEFFEKPVSLVALSAKIKEMLPRAEVRLTDEQEFQFRKAMKDLQPAWSDWLFPKAGEKRRANAFAAVAKLLRVREADIGLFQSFMRKLGEENLSKVILDDVLVSQLLSQIREIVAAGKDFGVLFEPQRTESEYREEERYPEDSTSQFSGETKQHAGFYKVVTESQKLEVVGLIQSTSLPGKQRAEVRRKELIEGEGVVPGYALEDIDALRQDLVMEHATDFRNSKGYRVLGSQMIYLENYTKRYQVEEATPQDEQSPLLWLDLEAALQKKFRDVQIYHRAAAASAGHPGFYLEWKGSVTRTQAVLEAARQWLNERAAEAEQALAAERATHETDLRSELRDEKPADKNLGVSRLKTPWLQIISGIAATLIGGIPGMAVGSLVSVFISIPSEESFAFLVFCGVLYGVASAVLFYPNVKESFEGNEQTEQVAATQIGVGIRSEVRLSDLEELRFWKAVKDLQPKWWDGRFNGKGVNRRMAAVAVLAKINNPRAVSALSMALQDENNEVRLTAIGALHALRATNELVAALDNENSSIRQAVIAALCDLKVSSTVPALTRLFETADRPMQEYLFFKLVDFRNSEILLALRKTAAKWQQDSEEKKRTFENSLKDMPREISYQPTKPEPKVEWGGRGDSGGLYTTTETEDVPDGPPIMIENPELQAISREMEKLEMNQARVRAALITAEKINSEIIANDRPRSEVRLSDLEELRFWKAAKDLQPAWYDGLFAKLGEKRRIAALSVMANLLQVPEADLPLLRAFAEKFGAKNLSKVTWDDVPVSELLAQIRAITGAGKDFGVLFEPRVFSMDESKAKRQKIEIFEVGADGRRSELRAFTLGVDEGEGVVPGYALEDIDALRQDLVMEHATDFRNSKGYRVLGSQMIYLENYTKRYQVEEATPQDEQSPLLWLDLEAALQKKFRDVQIYHRAAAASAGHPGFYLEWKGSVTRTQAVLEAARQWLNERAAEAERATHETGIRSEVRTIERADDGAGKRTKESILAEKFPTVEQLSVKRPAKWQFWMKDPVVEHLKTFTTYYVTAYGFSPTAGWLTAFVNMYLARFGKHPTFEAFKSVLPPSHLDRLAFIKDLKRLSPSDLPTKKIRSEVRVGEWETPRDGVVQEFGWTHKLPVDQTREQDAQMSRLLTNFSGAEYFSPSWTYDVRFALSSGGARELQAGRIIFDIYVRPVEQEKSDVQRFYKGFVTLYFADGKLAKWDNLQVNDIRLRTHPWLKAFLTEKLDGLKNVSFARSEVRWTPAEIANHLKIVFQAWKIDAESATSPTEQTKNLADRIYVTEMTRKHLAPKDAAIDHEGPKAPLRARKIKGSLNEASLDGNAVVTALLTDDEMKARGVIKRKSLAEAPADKIKKWLEVASRTFLTWNTLDGGIGESLMREAWLLNKGLRARLKTILTEPGSVEAKYQTALADLEVAEEKGETADIIAALRELEKLAGFEPLKVKMGAKGTDLGRVEKIQGNEYFVGDAEARLLFMVDLATSKQVGKIAFQPFVNYQSKASYEKLMNQPYLWDIISGVAKPRTYAQALQEAGIEVLEPLEQKDLPKFEVEPGESQGLPTADSENKAKGQPGGHGQWGLFYMIDFTENAPASDGLHHVRFFGNGDNRKGNPEPLVAGYVVEERIPMLKIVTPATAIDKKGGKEVIRIIRMIIRGIAKVFNVLDQWEEIDAKMAKQASLFYAAGQRNGFGQEGKQLFNTNLFYFNEDLMHSILREMRDIVGQNAFLDAVMPVLFDKSDKAIEIDGKKYVSMDSAIGYVIHNLNTFYSTDERLEGLREKYGKQLLYYMEYDRDIFAPKKKAEDQFLQEATDYYGGFDVAIKNFHDSEPGLTPPGFDITDPIVKLNKDTQMDEAADSKFWNEAQHWLDSFGFMRVRKMKSLKIEGRVTVRNAEFIGDVVILNRFGQTDLKKPAKRVVLSSGPYLERLKQLGFWTGDHLLLENVMIIISEDGSLSVQRVLPDGAMALRSTQEALGEFKRLKAQGANITISPGFEIINGGELIIVRNDFKKGVHLFFGNNVKIDGGHVRMRFLAKKHQLTIDGGTVFDGPRGLLLDLVLKEGEMVDASGELNDDWLHINPTVLRETIQALNEGKKEKVLDGYREHVDKNELNKAFFIRCIVDSLTASPLQGTALIPNARWLQEQINGYEAQRSKASRAEVRETGEFSHAAEEPLARQQAMAKIRAFFNEKMSEVLAATMRQEGWTSASSVLFAQVVRGLFNDTPKASWAGALSPDELQAARIYASWYLQDLGIAVPVFFGTERDPVAAFADRHYVLTVSRPQFTESILKLRATNPAFRDAKEIIAHVVLKMPMLPATDGTTPKSITVRVPDVTRVRKPEAAAAAFVRHFFNALNREPELANYSPDQLLKMIAGISFRAEVRQFGPDQYFLDPESRIMFWIDAMADAAHALLGVLYTGGDMDEPERISTEDLTDEMSEDRIQDVTAEVTQYLDLFKRNDFRPQTDRDMLVQLNNGAQLIVKAQTGILLLAPEQATAEGKGTWAILRMAMFKFNRHLQPRWIEPLAKKSEAQPQPALPASELVAGPSASVVPAVVKTVPLTPNASVKRAEVRQFGPDQYFLNPENGIVFWIDTMTDKTHVLLGLLHANSATDESQPISTWEFEDEITENGFRDVTAEVTQYLERFKRNDFRPKPDSDVRVSLDNGAQLIVKAQTGILLLAPEQASLEGKETWAVLRMAMLKFNRVLQPGWMEPMGTNPITQSKTTLPAPALVTPAASAVPKTVPLTSGTPDERSEVRELASQYPAPALSLTSATENLPAQFRTAEEVMGYIFARAVTTLKSWNVIARAFFAEHFSASAVMMRGVNVAAAQQVLPIEVAETGQVIVVTPSVVEMGLLPILRAVYRSSDIFVIGADDVQERLTRELEQKMAGLNTGTAIEFVKDVPDFQRAVAKRAAKRGVSTLQFSGLSTASDLMLAQSLKEQIPDFVYVTNGIFQRFQPYTNGFIQGLVTEFRAAISRERSA